MPPLKRTAAYALEWQEAPEGPWYLWRVVLGADLDWAVDRLRRVDGEGPKQPYDWRVRCVPTGAGQSQRRKG